jgi:DNA-binding transcriptional LysR family regulator
MMFERIDPTQLLALHALLEEGQVTRAARRLGITQSSMSHRLSQLRRGLGDELFVREGTSLVPTMRALAIKAPLAEALRALELAVSSPATFDPRSAKLGLLLFLPDLLMPLVPRLLNSLRSEAPALELRVRAVSVELSDALSSATPSLAMAPAHFVRNQIVVKTLGQLKFGVVGRRGHPAMRRPLTLERWLDHAHVVVSIGNAVANPIELALHEQGLQRRVGLEVPSFLAGLFAVSCSDLLMNAPMPLVSEAKQRLSLQLRPAPLALPSVRFVLCWHERFKRDLGHRWLRERLFEAVRPLFDAQGQQHVPRAHK